MSAFLYGYIRLNNVKLSAILRHKLIWGLIAAIPLSFFSVKSVLMQPAPPAPQGMELAFDIFWSGIVYGALDAIFLSVFPVYAMWQVLKIKGWTYNNNGLKWKAVAGASALAASLLMIVVYHLGYPELRGPQVIMVVLGVGVMSLAYIVTGNPTVAIISHIAMHISAVLHGAEGVSQLPPYYE